MTTTTNSLGDTPPTVCPVCTGPCTFPGEGPTGQLGGLCTVCGWDYLTAGVSDGHTSSPEPAAPERIDPVTGEVVPAPTFKPMDVTDWTDEELERLEAADALTIETWEASTIPAPEPRKVTGLDGKTYTRPEPKETPKETTMTTASRLAIPQPPKHGGNRPKHNQVIGNVIVSAQGLCIVADEIKTLDGSINSEEAASYADDLSRIIRSLKRIQQLLTKEA